MAIEPGLVFAGRTWAYATADPPPDAEPTAPDTNLAPGEPDRSGVIPGNGAGSGGSLPFGNHRPELRRIGDRDFSAGQQSKIQLEATDFDDDPLFFGLRSSAPPGAKFAKNTGKFTWTPEACHVGITFMITFEVSERLFTDRETEPIVVVNAGQTPNRAPQFDEVGHQPVTAGQPFELQLAATDPNGDAISYAINGSFEGAKNAYRQCSPDPGSTRRVPTRFVSRNVTTLPSSVLSSVRGEHHAFFQTRRRSRIESVESHEG